MSFAAVLVLIAGWERVRPLPAEWRSSRGPARPGARLALWLAGGVATSLIAGAATTPFGLHHFGRLQLYGVAANALAVPITSALVMPAGMAAVALMPFGLEWLALAAMGWGWRQSSPWRARSRPGRARRRRRRRCRPGAWR
jgi:competence protein ComEC